MGTNLSHSDYAMVRSDAGQFPTESNTSGVSWGAVIGGAFVIAALYLLLLALGAGFGLTATAISLDTAAVVWMLATEVIACSLGGYLTGRLRTKWTAVHSDEIYFRDTANGFLAWAVSLVAILSLLGTAATRMAGQVALGAAEARSVAETVTENPTAAAHFLLWLFLSMLLGAFCASFAATIGGRQRDHVKPAV